MNLRNSRLSQSPNFEGSIQLKLPLEPCADDPHEYPFSHIVCFDKWETQFKTCKGRLELMSGSLIELQRLSIEVGMNYLNPLRLYLIIINK